jgi:methyl-accepting chemotaxis protein
MKRFSISLKIWLSIGVFVLGYVLSTGLGQLQGIYTEARLGAVAAALYPASQESQTANAAFQRMTKGFSDAVLMQESAALDRSQTDAQIAVKSLRAIGGMSALGEERTARAASLAQAISKLASEGRTVYGSMLSADATMTDDLQQRSRKIASDTESITRNLQKFGEQASGDLRAEVDGLAHRSAQQRWTALGVFALTLIAATVVVTLTVRRSITGPILRVIEGVRAAADKAGSASDRMAKSGDIVARGASEQATCLEETSASLEEMAATTRQNADRATRADELMREARKTVDRATGSMKEVTASIGEISRATSQVASVLKSIDEIAFQTNILALNAAVEAARAGEAGAGFSVVADEVRALAQRAAEAARNSSGLIEQTVGLVRTGVDQVAFTQEAFTNILKAVITGSEVVAEIAISSREQSNGIDHIGHAVQRMESVTQANAANAQDTACAASTMHSEVEQTRGYIDELVSVLGVSGKK